MINAMSDLALLTDVSEKLLRKIAAKEILAICQGISEDSKVNDDTKKICEFDIGIGTLYIMYTPEIKYQFRPSEQMESAVACTVLGKQNPLLSSVNVSMRKQFMEAYKDLC